MNGASKILYRAALFTILLLPMGGITSVQAAIPASERTVLLDLYASTNGANWTDSTGWGGPAGTECSWYGISCDQSGVTVARIMLPGNNLAGPIPSLSGLTNLESFQAWSNTLTGTIPELSGLVNLAFFNVSTNLLTGTIPELSALTNLQAFGAASNQLTGSLPALSGLTNLSSFNVSINQLTGPIPPLTGLSNLNNFYLNANKLTGPLPELTGLTSLQQFEAFNNQLTGPIPTLTGLTNLQGLSVSGNQLSGSIPALTGLISLRRLIVYSNRLTGSIPALTGLTNLRELYLYSNQLTGSIPTLTGLMNLQTFSASSNQLTGSIPSLSELINLKTFAVNSNQLTGPIPALTGLTKLQYFLVKQNQLTGDVPAVPSPNALAAGSSTLCPNFLNHTPDAAWDAATGVTPWFSSCTAGAASPMVGSVVSRKVHAAAGTFDLALNGVTTNPSTEPRQGPAHLLVFTFDKAVTGGAAAVSEGTATVGTPTFSGNEMRVPLTGVGNQQYVTVTVSNIAAADGGTGGSGSIRVGFLAGDVNQSRVVTLADLGQVNAQVAQAVTGSNYLKDVNASGTFSLADKGLTNQQLTKALPAP